MAIATASDPIAGVANHTMITGNTVNTPNVFDGIDACSNGNTISSNRINGAIEAAIHLDDTCGTTGNNNTVMSDTVSLACAGVMKGTSTTGNTITNITYFNVSAQHPLQESCSPAPPRVNAEKHAHPRVKPARP